MGRRVSRLELERIEAVERSVGSVIAFGRLCFRDDVTEKEPDRKAELLPSMHRVHRKHRRRLQGNRIRCRRSRTAGEMCQT